MTRAFSTEGEWFPFSDPTRAAAVESFTLPDRIISIGVDRDSLVCVASDGQIYRVTHIGGTHLPNKHRKQKRLKRVAAAMAWLAVMLSGCATTFDPKCCVGPCAKPDTAVQVDPYTPPATLAVPLGQASLACNGVDAVCWKRGDVTRCWCGERR